MILDIFWMYSLNICISSFVKCLNILPFKVFLDCLSFSKLSCRCFLGTLKISSLSRIWKVKVLVTRSCLTLVTPWTECSLPGFSVHGFLQARILEWVAMPFFRSSWPRDERTVSLLSEFLALVFSWFTVPVRTSATVFSKGDESAHPCLVLYLRGKIFKISLSMMLVFHCVFYQVEKAPFKSLYWPFFNHKRVLNFIKCFFLHWLKWSQTSFLSLFCQYSEWCGFIFKNWSNHIVWDNPHVVILYYPSYLLLVSVFYLNLYIQGDVF